MFRAVYVPSTQTTFSAYKYSIHSHYHVEKVLKSTFIMFPNAVSPFSVFKHTIEEMKQTGHVHFRKSI